MPPKSSTRPQTSRQAHRTYLKRGPTVCLSERELKQLERSAELQERADRIKERENKRKANLKKKNERVEKERDARQRMGISTPVKETVGASQMRLGAFMGIGMGLKRKREDTPVLTPSSSSENSNGSGSQRSAVEKQASPARKPLQSRSGNQINRISSEPPQKETFHKNTQSPRTVANHGSSGAASKPPAKPPVGQPAKIWAPGLSRPSTTPQAMRLPQGPKSPHRSPNQTAPSISPKPPTGKATVLSMPPPPSKPNPRTTQFKPPSNSNSPNSFSPRPQPANASPGASMMPPSTCKSMAPPRTTPMPPPPRTTPMPPLPTTKFTRPPPPTTKPMPPPPRPTPSIKRPIPPPTLKTPQPPPQPLEDPWAAFLVSNTQIERELSIDDKPSAAPIVHPSIKPRPYQKHGFTSAKASSKASFLSTLMPPPRVETASLLAGLCTQDLAYDDYDSATEEDEPPTPKGPSLVEKAMAQSFGDDGLSDSEFEDMARNVEERSSGQSISQTAVQEKQKVRASEEQEAKESEERKAKESFCDDLFDISTQELCELDA